LALVRRGAAELPREHARHCGLWPSGVGRIVLVRVPEHRRETAASRCAENESGEPCRKQIHDVIRARRGPAECAIPLVPMTNQGVRSADGLEYEETRQSCNEKPKGRSDNAVAEALRKTLDGRG